MAKAQVSLAVMGPSQSGKTTVLGKLSASLDAFDPEAHRQVQDLAWELGRPAYAHGWMLDRLQDERELGSTVLSSMQRFESSNCSYCAFDTPGRQDLARNYLSVMSLADVAVLVVSAAQGEWEAAVDSGTVKGLALDSFTMGIKHVVVWVTKMDDYTVQFDSARYEEIKKAMTAFLKEVGYKLKDLPVIPVAGLSGENLTSKSSEMPWYAGHSAIEALDSLGEMNRPAEKPLRLPVLKVHDVPDVGCVIVGRVETGSIRPGIKVIFSPSGLVAEVKSLLRAGKKLSEAQGGDVVSVNLRVEKRKAPNSRRTVSTFCTVGPNGKPSFTELYTLSHLKHPETQEPYSLVVLKLHTGRTHQIRVHMLSIGHPLVTDSKYAEERLASDRSWCPRNFLHTYRLAFRDVPSDQELEEHGFGEVQELVTPLPNDLTQTLQSLEPVDEISRKHWEDWCAGEVSHLQAFEKYLEAAQNA